MSPEKGVEGSRVLMGSSCVKTNGRRPPSSLHPRKLLFTSGSYADGPRKRICTPIARRAHIQARTRPRGAAGMAPAMAPRSVMA